MRISLATAHLNHPLSDDGRYVFFTDDSSSKKTPTASTDAYQYNHETEQVSLLSSGHQHDLPRSSSTPPPTAATHSSSPDPNWSPADHDQSNDVYDVRVGGGFSGAAGARPL